MAKKKKTFPIRIEEFCGIEYLVAENVPAYDGGKYGPIIDLDPKEMELLAAVAIVENNYPIRGKEVHLFRSVVDLSLERFAGVFGLSGAGVLKWERNPSKRLDLANELMIRSYMAEKLDIKKTFRFSDALKVEDQKIRETFSIRYKAS